MVKSLGRGRTAYLTVGEYSLVFSGVVIRWFCLEKTRRYSGACRLDECLSLSSLPSSAFTSSKL